MFYLILESNDIFWSRKVECVISFLGYSSSTDCESLG